MAPKPNPFLNAGRVLGLSAALTIAACGGGGGSGASSGGPPDSPELTASIATQTSAPLPAPPARSFAGPLGKVRSYEYAIATNTSTPGINAKIANSPADLVLMTWVRGDPPLDRVAADPTGKKLIFGYINVGEAAPYQDPSLFAGASLPSWFGKLNPGFTDLYSVQYWNVAWEQELFPLIDEIIAAGFDGIFLDVLSADSEWQAGNAEGNPVYADATSAMATLVAHIRAYIDAHHAGHTVYLIGNNPGSLAQQYPAALRKLDAIFNELAFWAQPVDNGLTSEYVGPRNASYIANTLAPAYAAADVPVFGNDYPLPLSESSNTLPGFSMYSALGWVPSVTNARQDERIYSSGPFMFMATRTNATVTGAGSFTNYLSGGVAPSATLVGGDQGDFFIGGPGENTIMGGAGDDTIWAHPEYALQKGKLVISISSDRKGVATVPTVALAVNGTNVLPVSPVTAVYGTDVQSITVGVPSGVAITSVVMTVADTSYTDSNNLSNVVIHNVAYDGVRIDPGLATFSAGHASAGYVYSSDGTVTFPQAAFAVSSPFLGNTSDAIDGGGGSNVVIYRGPSSAYSIVKKSDASWRVTSSSTAEGPDTLRNIQSLRFSDKTVTLQ